MADINSNFFNGNNIIKPSEQCQVVIDKEAVGRTLKKMAAPVFDFFTKEGKPEEIITDYEAEIQKYEMRTAITKRILNDSDPKSRTKMNIVI